MSVNLPVARLERKYYLLFVFICISVYIDICIHCKYTHLRVHRHLYA